MDAASAKNSLAEITDDLLREVQRMVNHHVRRLVPDRSYLYTSGLGKEDVVAETVLRTLLNVAQFDESRGVSIYAHLFAKARYNLIDVLRENDERSRRSQTEAKELLGTGSYSPDKKILTIQDLPAKMQHAERVGLFGNEHWAAHVAASGVDEEYGRVEDRSAVRAAIRDAPLTWREAYVLRSYFWMDMSLVDIGVTMNVTESRVSQIKKGALEKLYYFLSPDYDEVISEMMKNAVQ